MFSLLKEKVYWGEGTPKIEEFEIKGKEVNPLLQPESNPEYVYIAYGGIPAGFERKKTPIKDLFNKVLYKNIYTETRTYSNKKYPDLGLYADFLPAPPDFDEQLIGIRLVGIGPKKEINYKYRREDLAPILCHEPVIGRDIYSTWKIKYELMEKAIHQMCGNYQPKDKVEKQLLDLIRQIGAEGIYEEQKRYREQEKVWGMEDRPQLTPEEELELIKILSNYEIQARENYKNISSGLDKQKQSN